MTRIILIPGLGADADLFKNIDLKNIPGYTIHTISYLTPQKNESLKAYSERLIQTIPPGDNMIIIGVSFGGILAQEIAKRMAAEKIILVSSLSSAMQKPFYFSLVKILPLYKILPEKWLKQLFILFGRMMTSKTPEDQLLFESMVRRADIDLIRWGIDRILYWQQQQAPNNVIQIHGSGDKLFPIRRIQASYVIEKGEHFMIVNRSREINPLLIHLITT